MYRFLSVFQAVLLLCCLHNGHTQNTGPDSVTVIPGDITIAAMFSLNDIEDGACGDFDVHALQSLVGITWFIEAINAMNFVPGITIGLEVYRTCRIPGVATEGVAKLLNKYGVLGENASQDGILFGMLGPDRTSEALQVSSFISSLPTSHRLLQISGSATGKQLSDKTLYPNFFRVIPPDDTQVKVMLELLLQLQWNYVAIVYDDDDYGRSAAEELRRLAEGRQICIPVYESVPLDTRSENFSSQAASIWSKLTSSKNGLVRGMVILGSASTTKHLQQALSKLITYVSLVLSEAVALDRATLLKTNDQVSSLSAGALVTSPPYILVPELVPLWNNTWSNQTAFRQQAAKIPWLNDYLSQLNGCSTNKPTCCSANDPSCWQQTQKQRTAQMIQTEELLLYTGYQVKAMAVMAALLQRRHQSLCKGVGQSSLCPRLKEEISQRSDILDSLRKSTFNLSVFSSVSEAFTNDTSIRFSGTDSSVQTDDETKTTYDVFNFRRDQANRFNFQKIGSWTDQGLNVSKSQAEFYDEYLSPLTWSQLPPAHCQNDHDCVTCERDVSKDIIFVKGDFYIVSIVPVNDKNPNDLLSCGEVKPLWGADIAQSIVFAVEEVNRRTGIFKDVLPNRKVGLVTLNSCSNPIVVRQRLMDLLGGTLVLSDGRNSSSLLPYIMGYVGPSLSYNSIAASETLNAFKRPFVQISGGSTAPELSDTQKHPYFLRLPVPDDKQAQALLDIVHTLGANYVQVIYDSTTTYTTELLDKLREEITNTNKYNVCIAQSIATTPQHGDSQDYIRITSELREKYSAKIVIVLLHPVEIEKFLDATLPRLEKGEFLFLAPEAWGRRQQLLQEGPDRIKLEGSLVLSQELVIDQFFQRYFLELDPTKSINPWLKSFWEARLNCYVGMSFTRQGKTGPCPEKVAENYVQDPLVPFHIDAVYALVLGFTSALTQHCGPQATHICDALTSSALFSAMLKVKLDLYGTGQRTELFQSNGDGLVGYNVLQISRDLSTSEEDVMYDKVGAWTQTQLTLDSQKLFLLGGPNFKSECPGVNECNICFRRNSSSSSSANKLEATQISVPTFAGVTVVLIVIIAVLVAVVIISVRRLKLQKRDKTDRRARSAFDNTAYRENASESRVYLTIHPSHTPPPPRCHPRQPPDYLHAVKGEGEEVTPTQQDGDEHLD